ncbi:MAG: chorismate mutase [Beggiatoa sp. IS2]|nr:MAG: chorismate mutase [Beggiatoa sp. IS2]
MSHDNLLILREQIDELDTRIQDLLNQRARLAEEVARTKYVQESNPTFHRPEREMAILSKVIDRNRGPLSNETLVLIFHEIISACLALQKPLQVAFLGPEGTYSQAAVRKHFGHAVQTIAVPTIDSVFREVESGHIEYGVVPVENSTEGGINQTLDCLVNTSLKICGEILLPIHHHLLTKSSDLAQLTRIYSHPQSFAQCRLWLDTHLPTLERLAVVSNAEAARRAAQEPGTAAIAGQTAAEIYQLNPLATQIEDDVKNTTRFVVLGCQDVPPSGADKTSLLLSVPNKPGALYRLLQPFADYAVNMTHLESRPSRQDLWEYVFFLDIEGHIQDQAITNALQVLRDHTSFVKSLGSYPRAIDR